MVGVVWQEDLLLPNLTVKETVHFAPRLKTPKHRSDEDLDLLLIGTSFGCVGWGISGGERKEVSVAVELVA